jgi:hypothetical protein
MKALVLLFFVPGVAVAAAWMLWTFVRGARRDFATIETDPRVRLGPDGFVFEDPRTPIDWEISYESQAANGALHRGSFVLGTRKLFIYTGHEPVGVRILDAAPPGNRVAPGKQWLPGQKVGGHKQPNRPLHDETQIDSTDDRPTPPSSPGFQLPGPWGIGSSSTGGASYPTSYSEATTETAGDAYRGGDGEGGGGGSTASWGDDTTSSSSDSSAEAQSSSDSGNASFPSAY